MPRTARVVAPGFPHHVTQRGNYRQTVFEEDSDRVKYLAWIKNYSEKCGLKIWAYCLMSNHVHFIAVPSRPDSLARTFNQAHMRYSQYFNLKKGQKGHLWQGRFYSCILDEVHLFTAARYIENNPVRAGLVKRAEDYPWSSAASHINGVDDPVLSGDLPLLDLVTDWREFLALDEDEKTLKNLRNCTQSGRPAGSDDFTGILEGILGVSIKTRAVGRPRKKRV